MGEKWKQYEIEDGEIKGKKKSCPKCGSGTFMAEHDNRWQCGNCGYTKYKK